MQLGMSEGVCVCMGLGVHVCLAQHVCACVWPKKALAKKGQSLRTHEKYEMGL